MAGSERRPVAPKSIRLPAFAGMRNDRLPEEFDAADLAAAVNVDLTDAGSARRRQGRVTTLLQAGAHSLWSNGRVCLFSAGGALRSLNLAFDEATPLADVTPDAPVVYEDVAGRVYWTNGEQSGVVEAGANRSWGLEPPPIVGASPAPGSLPEGRYGITATYVAADGQESGAPATTLIDLPDGGGIEVFLVPSEDWRVVAQRIYLTTPNGDVPYLAGVVDATEVNAVVSFDVTQLQIPLQTMLMQPCPHGTGLAYHRGRMYVAKDHYVFYSQPFSPELFLLTDFMQFPSPVRMIAAVEGGLYVSDAERVYWLGGATPGEFVVRELECGAAARGQPAYAAATELFPDMSADVTVALWMGERGPTAGLPDGVARPLNDKWRIDLPAAVGQAFYRRPGMPHQYLATFIGG